MDDESRNKAIAMFVAMLDALPEGNEPVCFYLAAVPKLATVAHLVNLPTVDVAVLERSRSRDSALRRACAGAIAALIERQKSGDNGDSAMLRVPLS